MENYKYKPVIQNVAILTILVGALVLVAWLLDIERLETILPGYSSMKFNTALCFLFSGTYLYIFLNGSRKTVTLSKILPILVLFITLLIVAEYIFNFYSFVDEFFIRDLHPHIYDNTPKGRMSKTTCYCFIIISVSLLNAESRNYWVRMLTQWALHIVSLLAILVVLGYIYRVPEYYKLLVFGSVALHTGVTLFCLSIAISMLNPAYGITGLLSGERIGNIMARRLYPVVVAFILSITYFRLEVYRQSTLGMEFTTIMFTTIVLLTNLFLVWRTAAQLNKIDIKRKDAENSLVNLNKELEQKVEERTYILQDTLGKLEASQTELSEALNKEKELNEMKSRFVSMASHEFKTPLSTILSSASLVSNYVKADDKASRDKHIARIKNSVKHLNALLDDFLSVGKLEASRILVDRMHFTVKEFLDDVLEEIKIGLKQGQTIQFIQEGSHEFATDMRLLKNILINILGNAIKFSPENGVIVLQVNNNGSCLLLSVKDQGIGILEKDQQHLFNSFYRGSNAVNIEGTGLGLHIVKRYVDLLNGTITLTSEARKGTVVTIQLPLLYEEITLPVL